MPNRSWDEFDEEADQEANAIRKHRSMTPKTRLAKMQTKADAKAEPMTLSGFLGGGRKQNAK